MQQILVVFIKGYSLRKSVTKFTPKKFYEIDSSWKSVVFFPCKPFQLSLMFVSKARAHLNEALGFCLSQKY